MSLLVEIATRADVPLEAVVRVLTREPVNHAHKLRILAVLDHLGAEETRVLQRFALAAVHDLIPHAERVAVDHEAIVAELVESPLELPEAVRLELEPAGGQEIEEAEIETLPAALDPAPLVQLGNVLGELSEAVRDLRQETDAERRERVDDLAVLIDLITKGWEGVDRRLGRMERRLGRLEPASDRTLAAYAPPVAPPAEPPVEPPPVPEPEPPPPPPEGEAERSSLRGRLPLIAALALGIAIGAVAAVDLPSRLDASAVIADRGSEDALRRAQLPTDVAQTPQAPVQLPRTTLPRTAAPKGSTTPQRRATATTAAEPSSRPARPAAKPTTTTARPSTTTTRTQTTQPSTAKPAAPKPQPHTDFTPSRNWAWPPADGADYYLVEFFRAGQPLYQARPREARLTLPASITFGPGVYRWRVRPGHGEPGENRLDPPIVDSEFILNG